MRHDLEARIERSYERLTLVDHVYLLRDSTTDYGELPDIETSTKVYKAGILRIPSDFHGGIHVMEYPDFLPPKDKSDVSLIFRVSPREAFLKSELEKTILEKTDLPLPRPSKFDKMLNSNRGAFSARLAPEMARVILERFSDDPKDETGLIEKR